MDDMMREEQNGKGRRLRQRRNGGRAAARGAIGAQQPPESASGEERDFGEVLRHELNNPLTGILGNAELLLMAVRRKNLELPGAAEQRLETIATLAVRMRETVRRLSEEWEEQAEETALELVDRPN